MPDKSRSREDLMEDEKRIGENIPEGMKGLDTEDVGNPVERHSADDSSAEE